MKKFATSLLMLLVATLASEIALLVNNDTVMTVAALISFVLLFLSAIYEFIGLKKAAPDDEGYSKAYQAAVGLILAVILGIILALVWKDVFSDNSTWLFTVVEILIGYYVITTTIKRLEANGNAAEVKLGKDALLAMEINWTASVLASVLALFFKEGSFIKIIREVGYTMQIVGTAYFYVFLSKAYKKL